jgi:hypothetical protein
MMDINQIVTVTVAESWDFEASEGQNLFTGIVCEKLLLIW